MIDLKKDTGLAIVFDADTNTLLFEGKKILPSVRKLKDMSDVVLDRKWLGKASPEKELYYMFRGISRKEDAEIIQKNNLRYDITVIPPGTIGKEYIKTAGHIHPLVPNTSVTYTELYEVVSGEGLYLLQKIDNNKVIDAYFVRAKSGDKIIIPPGYGHITINPGKDILIMANWVAHNFTSLYDPIKNLKGGAYFVTTEKILKNEAYTNKSIIIKNESYINKSKFLKFKNPEKIDLLHMKKLDSIYSMINNPYRLKFLTEPQNHKKLFDYVLKEPFEKVLLDQ